MATAEPKLGLALSGGGHRAAFFHIGVLAGLAELGLLRPVQVISTVSGGSIVGALYYLHVKNLLETKPDAEIGDEDYVEIVAAVEREYRKASEANVRGRGFSSLRANIEMAKPSYSRTDRVAEVYERHFYAGVWGNRPRRGGRIAMRDLLIAPAGHVGDFNPDRHNPARRAPVPILLLESTTLNTGHNWRFEAMYMGEPDRQGELQSDVDKNTILARTAWTALPESRRDFPLGAAVASSAAFPGGFPPMQIHGLYPDLVVELTDGGVHDNQGIEGLLDRACTHVVISDGSGQMPDVAEAVVADPGGARPRGLDLRRRRAGAAAAAGARAGQRRLRASRDGARGVHARARRRAGDAPARAHDCGFRRRRARPARARPGAHRPRRVLRGGGVVADGGRPRAHLDDPAAPDDGRPRSGRRSGSVRGRSTRWPRSSRRPPTAT